jgi:hypothetical protein
MGVSRRGTGEQIEKKSPEELLRDLGMFSLD